MQDRCSAASTGLRSANPAASDPLLHCGAQRETAAPTQSRTSSPSDVTAKQEIPVFLSSRASHMRLRVLLKQTKVGNFRRGLSRLVVRTARTVSFFLFRFPRCVFGGCKGRMAWTDALGRAAGPLFSFAQADTQVARYLGGLRDRQGLPVVLLFARRSGRGMAVAPDCDRESRGARGRDCPVRHVSHSLLRISFIHPFLRHWRRYL